MKRYKLIANPAAGRGKVSLVLSEVLGNFRRRGAAFDLELTAGPRDAARIARDASAAFDAIVVIGGDGTVNDVLPGMLFASRPLGIIPAGSGNDFVKALGIPNNIRKAVDIVLEGKTRVLDLGRINGRHFANGVGIGFDAAVNRASYGINHSKKGLLLYLCALLKTLGRFDPVPLNLVMNGERVEGKFFLVTIGNGTTVGGGFRLTPHAVPDDQLLDVTLVRPIRLLPLLWHLPKVFSGTIDRATGYARLSRTGKIIVESDRSVPVHVDGEIYPWDGRRLGIEVVPKALRVIGRF